MLNIQTGSHKNFYFYVMRPLNYISGLLLFAFLFSCTDDKPGHTSGPENGYLVIVGGNLTDSAIYKKFLELAGGLDASIVIIPTAGSDENLYDNEGLEKIKERFRDHRFHNFTLLHTRDPGEANSAAFVKPIREASGVWFTGGRQWRLADAYLGTRTHDELFKLLERGGVIGGSSAGASIQASYMVRGDSKTNVVMMGDHEEGFGFITDCAIDQHLLALNRQFDILEITRAHPHLLGIGLDENTAIVVHNDEFEVIGQSFVAVYDGTFCNFIRDKADWTLERAEVTALPQHSERFYLLGKGRRYDLKERRVIEGSK